MKKGFKDGAAAVLLIAAIIIVSAISNHDAQSESEGPTQPIFFSHKIFLNGEYKQNMVK